MAIRTHALKNVPVELNGFWKMSSFFFPPQATARGTHGYTEGPVAF